MLIAKKWLDSETGAVWIELLVPLFSGAKMPGTSSRPTMATAMAFSMMVEMTSLTPRKTFSRPAMLAYRPPTSMAVISSSGIWMNDGRSSLLPTKAANSAATLYWPSTPMLKRFIRKPKAAAAAAR